MRGDLVTRPTIPMSLNFTPLANGLCNFALPYLSNNNSNKNNNNNILHFPSIPKLILLLKYDVSKLKTRFS